MTDLIYAIYSRASFNIRPRKAKTGLQDAKDRDELLISNYTLKIIHK
jgi:hypothetical protein